MVFSSYIFVLAFLPVVLIGYYSLSKLKNGIYQRLFLIASSLFFYGFYNAKYLLLIVGSIVVNYAVALLIQKYHSKAVFVIGIIYNVALIGFFKYYDFFIQNVNAVFKTGFAEKNLLLPLGISFFTFQQLSFLVSVFKKEQKVEKFVDYCLFVSFFPQLVAGPIVLYGEMMPQFREDNRRYFNADNFSRGLYMFTAGLFKKAVIADTLAIFADNGFGMTNLGLVTGWATCLSYTLQIYFDFSGYSDMAVGLGKMFNIDLPFNFLSPYKSESISEFWRRWHITLGRALSTYVYIPLGGNRKGTVRTCINLFVTFLVSGLWHGAAWTFVVWGALHGACVVIERIFKNQLEKIPKFIRIALTFLVVNCLWVLFRAESFAGAIGVYKGMINFGSLDFSGLAGIVADGLVNFPVIVDIAYFSGLTCLLLCVVFFAKNSFARLREFSLTKRAAILNALVLCVSLLFLSRESVFIYFNF